MTKALARRVLASAPVYAALRRRADSRRTLFLTYHTVGRDDEDFDAWTVVRRGEFLRQLEVLRRHFDVVSIDDALTRPAGARARVVLTFDDGHTGWHDHLLPIVEREAVPVTLYVATSHIEDAQPYWFDRVMNAVQLGSPVAVDLTRFGLGTRRFGVGVGPQAWMAVSSLLEALKACSEAARDEAVAALERAADGVPKRRFEPLRPLSIAQLRAVAAVPLVTIAAHSDDHRLLDRIPLAQARASLERCRDKLCAWTGRSVAHVAFPNGNCNAELSKLVAEMGFASAATTRAGRHRPGDDVYALPRVFVGRYDDLDRFKLALVGL
jgi:peptidoglycan/xylan/chitin deacetylase (PgdA/CDA1 family)